MALPHREEHQLQKHIDALQKELEELNDQLDSMERLHRETFFHNVYDVLEPAIRSFVRGQAAGTDPSPLEQRFGDALVGLGLQPVYKPGQTVDLWPEQAAELDLAGKQLQEDATMVRVEIVACGWARGERLVAPAHGRVIEVRS